MKIFMSNVSSDKVVVACVTSPSSVTLSGDIAAIEELQNAIRRREYFRTEAEG